MKQGKMRGEKEAKGLSVQRHNPGQNHAEPSSVHHDD